MISDANDVWEALFRRQAWGRYPAEHVVRFVARNFFGAADRRAIKLLDLGSGPGASSWFMAREGFSVCAIDGAPTAIAQLRDRLGQEGLAADARVGDIGELPWPERSFDGVIDNAVLYCNRASARRRIVAEVRRVLKPGGLLLSANFSDRTWGYGRGVADEPGGFVDVSEGPLANKGFAQFFGRAALDELYADFAERSIERASWTLENESRLIELWIVTCRAAA